MRTLWISFVQGLIGGTGAVAQPPSGTETNQPNAAPAIANLAVPNLRSLINFDPSLPTTEPASALFRSSSTLGTLGGRWKHDQSSSRIAEEFHA